MNKTLPVTLVLLSIISTLSPRVFAANELASRAVQDIQKYPIKSEQDGSTSQNTTRDGRIVRNPFSLQIITPRNTAIFGDRLSIRWNPVEGATRYNVVIDGLGVNENVQETQFDYNEVLTAGSYYNIQITANLEQENDKIDREDSVFIFVLSEDESMAVIQSVDSIRQGTGSELDKTLQVVEVYNQARLYSEAITAIEQYHEQYGVSAETERQLRELQKKVGLQTAPDSSNN